MTPEEFITKAKELVAQYENIKIEKQGIKWDRAKFDIKDIYVVWWSKTLQNAKAILSHNRTKGMLYEVTLDGENKKIYFDSYKKDKNVSVDI